MPTSSRAIALTRVSTDSQGSEDRAGLPAQRREIERIAAREGLEILEWVELRGVSGAQVRDDPRFVGLLAKLSGPDVDGVVVADFDRLFRRNRFEDYGILDAFADAHALLWTSDGTVDPTRESDGLLSVIRGELSGMERRRIKERTMRAKEVHRRAGRHVAGDQSLPYAVGYTRERGWFYKPAEAAVVREVFARIHAGERNYSHIARELGITRTLVARITRQPIYKGVRRIDRRYPAGQAVPRAPGDVIEQQVLDPPLIDPVIWDAVRAVATARPAPPRGDGPGLFRGLIVCARCGEPMHVHREKRGWSYRCRSSARGGYCTQIDQRVVDEAGSTVVGALARSPELLAQALEPVLAPAPDEALDVETIAQDRKRLTEERERVAVAFERGLRSLTEAERRTREIDAELERLERADTGGDGDADPLEVAAAIAEQLVEWDLLSEGQQRQVALTAVDWIRISRPRRATAAVQAIALRIPMNPPNRPALSSVGQIGRSLEVRLDEAWLCDTSPHS